MPTCKTAISQFLNDPNMTTVRESMYRDRLLYDLKFSAAKRGCDLQVMQPEVDNHGYDISIDDADNQRFFQLKVTTSSSATSSWNIHKRLLRPDWKYGQLFHLPASPEDTGLNGGVILTVVDDEDENCPIAYKYFDYFVFEAFLQRMIIEKKTKGKRKTANQFADGILKEFFNGVGRDKIRIPEQLFVTAKTNDDLLALIGFHSNSDVYLWGDNVAFAVKEGWNGIDGNGFTNVSKDNQGYHKGRNGAENLLKLICEDFRIPNSK